MAWPFDLISTFVCPRSRDELFCSTNSQLIADGSLVLFSPHRRTRCGRCLQSQHLFDLSAFRRGERFRDDASDVSAAKITEKKQMNKKRRERAWGEAAERYICIYIYIYICLYIYRYIYIPQMKVKGTWGQGTIKGNATTTSGLLPWWLVGRVTGNGPSRAPPRCYGNHHSLSEGGFLHKGALPPQQRAASFQDYSSWTQRSSLGVTDCKTFSLLLSSFPVCLPLILLMFRRTLEDGGSGVQAAWVRGPVRILFLSPRYSTFHVNCFFVFFLHNLSLSCSRCSEDVVMDDTTFL